MLLKKHLLFISMLAMSFHLFGEDFTEVRLQIEKLPHNDKRFYIENIIDRRTDRDDGYILTGFFPKKTPVLFINLIEEMQNALNIAYPKDNNKTPFLLVVRFFKTDYDDGYVSIIGLDFYSKNGENYYLRNSIDEYYSEPISDNNTYKKVINKLINKCMTRFSLEVTLSDDSPAFQLNDILQGTDRADQKIDTPDWQFSFVGTAFTGINSYGGGIEFNLRDANFIENGDCLLGARFGKTRNDTSYGLFYVSVDTYFKHKIFAFRSDYAIPIGFEEDENDKPHFLIGLLLQQSIELIPMKFPVLTMNIGLYESLLSSSTYTFDFGIEATAGFHF